MVGVEQVLPSLLGWYSVSFYTLAGPGASPNFMEMSKKLGIWNFL